MEAGRRLNRRPDFAACGFLPRVRHMWKLRELALLALLALFGSTAAMAETPARLVVTASEYILQGEHLSDTAELKRALLEAKHRELRIVADKDASYERIFAALKVVQEVGGISIGLVGTAGP